MAIYCKCGGEMEVIDSDPTSDNRQRRRRQCKVCGARVTTFEAKSESVVVVKGDTANVMKF